MAIPFRIKENEQDKERETVPVKVAVTPEPVSETENEQVTEEQLNGEESFVGRLLQELVGVYLRLSNIGRRSVGVVERRRRTRSENGPPSQNSTSTQLPDLIRCHNQPRPSHQLQTPVPNSSGANSPIRNHQDTNPELTTVSQTDDDITSELSLDTKMSIDFFYGRIGQDLRRIGDTFDTTNSNNFPTRRRHPAGNHGPIQEEIHLKLDLALSLVIPATLISLVLWKSRRS